MPDTEPVEPPIRCSATYLLLWLEFVVLAGGVGPPLEVMHALRHGDELRGPLQPRTGTRGTRFTDFNRDSIYKQTSLTISKENRQLILFILIFNLSLKSNFDHRVSTFTVECYPADLAAAGVVYGSVLAQGLRQSFHKRASEHFSSSSSRESNLVFLPRAEVLRFFYLLQICSNTVSTFLFIMKRVIKNVTPSRQVQTTPYFLMLFEHNKQSSINPKIVFLLSNQV